RSGLVRIVVDDVHGGCRPLLVGPTSHPVPERHVGLVVAGLDPARHGESALPPAVADGAGGQVQETHPGRAGAVGEAVERHLGAGDAGVVGEVHANVDVLVARVHVDARYLELDLVSQRRLEVVDTLVARVAGIRRT